MRSAAALGLFAALVTTAVLAIPTPAWTQDDGHGHKAEINLSELTAEQRVAALDAWAHVYCACPNENWSRTLANCPDGCAIAQKQEVLRGIQDGWSLDQIVKDQVAKYGPRASADPGTFANGTLMVLAGLVFGAGFAGVVLAKWRKSAADRRVATEAERAARPVASAETAAVERELQEIN